MLVKLLSWSFGKVKAFWERIAEGLEIQELWRQFKEEANASYGLYSKEVDWKSLGRKSRPKRLLKIGQELSWAMMLKLSPARRVFLLIALLLVFFALTNIRPLGGPSRLYVFLAVGSLLLLLALELADRIIMKRDLEIAREIQRWLVPEVPPQVAGLDIAFATQPANTVAGDCYDAFFRTMDGGHQLGTASCWWWPTWWAKVYLLPC